MQYFRKNVICLRPSTSKTPERQMGPAPALEGVVQRYGISFEQHTCNTKGELEFHLNRLAALGPYRILYLDFEGEPACLFLPDGSRVTLEQLAGLMQQNARTWIVHFGQGSVLDVSPTRLQDFAAATHVALIAGYKKGVDWLDASAMDSILIGSLQEYRDMASLWTRLTENYRELIRRTGLQIVALS